MNGILRFLATYCAFLWAGARYRIVDSAVSTSFGGNAWLLVASDVLRLRFTSDREELYLDFQGVDPAQSTSPDDPKSWYSVDILWHLLRGEPRDKGLLDEEFAAFVRENLSAIERVFSDPDTWDQTRKTLRGLQRQRAKRMFG